MRAVTINPRKKKKYDTKSSEGSIEVKILANQVLFQLIIKKRLIHRTHQAFSLYPNNYHHFYQKVSKFD